MTNTNTNTNNDDLADNILDMKERLVEIEKRLAISATTVQLDAVRAEALKARAAAEGAPNTYDQAASDRALRTAFVRATCALQVVAKDRQVDVTSKTGGRAYSFRYATYAELIAELRPHFAKHGLSFMQEPVLDEKSCTIITTFFHVDGGVLAPRPLVMPLLSRSPQDVGIVISYGRRYHLQTLTGLAASDDPELDDRRVEQTFQHRSEEPQPTPLERSAKSKIQHGLALRSAKDWNDLKRAANEVAGDRTLTAEDKGELLKVWATRKAELENAPTAEAKTDPVAEQFALDAATASAKGKAP